jgi:hypothetical protein
MKKDLIKLIAKSLASDGFIDEAKLLQEKIIKRALKVDSDLLNKIHEDIQEYILAMEYYPAGSGLFPENQEIGLFINLESENFIRSYMKKNGFIFQALLSKESFSGTILGSSSKALDTINEKDYYVCVFTI